MAFEKAIQALSGIEEKLRRAFNLAGPIGAKLDPTTSVVLIADDLRDPGHAFFSGRSWVHNTTDQGTPAGVNATTLQFGADVMIDGIAISGTLAVNASIQAYITTPSETAPIAVSGINTAWRDRKLVTVDAPPVLSNGSWAAITGTVVAVNNRVQTWRGGTAAQLDSVREMKLMIPSGGTLTFRSDTANSNLAICCWGRVWP